MKPALVILLLIISVIFISGCMQEAMTPSGQETPATPGEMSLPPVTSPAMVPASGLPDVVPGGPLPFIPGGTYHAGDRILMTGTTILSPGNRLLVEISSVSFVPANKTTDSRFSGTSAVITVEKGEQDSQNHWYYLIDTTDFAPDEYQVLISGITVPKFRDSTSFIITS